MAFRSGQQGIQVFEHLVLWRFMCWAVQCSQLGDVPLTFVVEEYYMHKRKLNYEAEGRKLKEAACESKTQLMTHI